MRLAGLILGIAAVLPGSAQTGSQAANNPVVELAGVIERVHLVPGEGSPYLEIRQGDRSINLRLGPMRYLIEHGFSPKAGQQIEAKGYRVGDSLVAIEVTLPTTGKTLKLRDTYGRPLWRGGRWRSGR